MTVNRAKKILGEMANNYSDEQVLELVKQVKTFADACVENIDNRMKNEGISFMYKI